MTVYALWPYLVIMSVLFLLAASPLLRVADAPPSRHDSRISALDGLRGVLALGVFFHHAAIYHGYLLDGQWRLPPSRFYTLIGQGAVAMFFMITGFLFWSRLINRKERIDWLALYVGRIFRIGPVYLVAVLCALIVIFLKVGFAPNVTAVELLDEIGHWLGLGYLPLTPVNGYSDAPRVLADVTWTLHYEWLFYASLLALAIPARWPNLHLPFAAGALLLSLVYLPIHPGAAAASVCLFLSGMLCGSLLHEGIVVKAPNVITSATAGFLIGLVFVAFNSAYTVGSIILLGGAFYFIASGSTLFGLLTSRPARRLGNVSYGIYLLQGLSFATVFMFASAKEAALGPPFGHWLIVLLCAVLLVSAATACHVLVERPGIALGKRLSDVLWMALRIDRSKGDLASGPTPARDRPVRPI
jgi:peptidoglycan/LPS O-acetylase OafA/YrhL